jgi:pimeloyl-ACP methyl ester carboxylesterase
MGYGLTMEGWDPRLVHALAGHHRVVMFDNAGIGRTRQLPVTASIDDMADQTSALITARTLIADGAEDALDPVGNDQTLHHLIHGSQLKLNPDAGHAFLFQDWSSFAAEVNRFLAAA